MDILNNSTLDSIDNTPILQFDKLDSGIFDAYANLEYLEVQDSGERFEEDFCLLPLYCLIEDKHIYLAG